MSLSPEEQSVFGMKTRPVIHARRRIQFGPTETYPRDRLIPFFDIDTTPNKFLSLKNHVPSHARQHWTGRRGLLDDDDDADKRVYKAVLDNELLNCQIDHVRMISKTSQPIVNGAIWNSSPSKRTCPFTYSPLSPNSVKLLRSPVKPVRKIHKVPYKILDAPELKDDFNYSLIDWSSKNILSVGLSASMYLWNAGSGHVTKLFDLGLGDDVITSVCWNDEGSILAVGTEQGSVQLWDSCEQKRLFKWTDHTERVCALSWNNQMLCSGSRDKSIVLRDPRARSSVLPLRYKFHDQEVSNLKWSFDKSFLASSSSDSRVAVWDPRQRKPFKVFDKHQGAVKALAWSCQDRDILASGGGIRDRCIRIWNLVTGQQVKSVDTGSQICNIMWSMHSAELVSTHGFNCNKTVIWDYPDMEPLAKLGGHSSRVLYLAMSPNGESIVTGGSDETLRFWRVFKKPLGWDAVGSSS